MRVAFDHQIFGWQRFGGISRYFFELAGHIARRTDGNVQVRVNSPLFVNDYLRHGSAELDVLGIRAPAIRRTGRIYRALNEVAAPAFLRAWHPDIVHETYYSRKTTAPKGCRVVLTVFDMIHELFSEHFAPWDTTCSEKKVALARADHIICISENTRQDLIRLLDVDAAKVSVVHLGFSLTCERTATLVAQPKPYLLFVGSRGGYKNFNRLLEAYAASKCLRNEFDLIAFGGGNFTAGERDLIRQLDLPDMAVRQIGGGDDVLGALYQGAALFIYPSLYEGFGIPPLEAMSFDCPVACSNTSSIPEVVGDAAVFFDPSSVDSIGGSLESIAHNERSRADLIAKGRERLRMFSWEACAEKTYQVYRSVLS